MLDIVVMAAGLGTRMKSGRAKVLHLLGGRPLVAHVSRAASELRPDGFVVIVGHQAEEVERAVRAAAERLEALPEPKFALQAEQLGTGHAVQQAMPHVGGGTVIVLSGDVPLVRAESLARLLESHRGGGFAATILSTRVDEPTGYGRIVRRQDGTFERIVEQKDASESERSIQEINTGIYAFEAAHLAPALDGLSNDNAQGEYYLTDVLGALVANGERVGLVAHEEAQEVLGVNSRVDLADTEALLRRRTLERLMLAGVTIVDPATTYVDDEVRIGADTTLLPGVVISGDTAIGERCTIGPWAHIQDARLGDEVLVRASTVIEQAEVGDGAQIGPFARLRPGARLGEEVHVGNFVEIKKSTLGRRSKANHLAYLGDAQIGDGCNIGAGTITCNYDGKNKHPTVIEDEVYIGSDTMLVAPVRVGRGSKTGAGAVVTKDVPERSLAVGVPARVVKRLDDA